MFEIKNKKFIKTHIEKREKIRNLEQLFQITKFLKKKL